MIPHLFCPRSNKKCTIFESQPFHSKWGCATFHQVWYSFINLVFIHHNHFLLSLLGINLWTSFTTLCSHKIENRLKGQHSTKDGSPKKQKVTLVNPFLLKLLKGCHIMMHNGYFTETNPIRHCWNIIGNSAHVGADYETVLAKKKSLWPIVCQRQPGIIFCEGVYRLTMGKYWSFRCLYRIRVPLSTCCTNLYRYLIKSLQALFDKIWYSMYELL